MASYILAVVNMMDVTWEPSALLLLSAGGLAVIMLVISLMTAGWSLLENLAGDRGQRLGDEHLERECPQMQVCVCACTSVNRRERDKNVYMCECMFVRETESMHMCIRAGVHACKRQKGRDDKRLKVRVSVGVCNREIWRGRESGRANVAQT